jgi:hypothetical protein
MNSRIVGQEDAIQAYESERFLDALRGIGDGEAVAGFMGGAVERNEGRNAGGIDALDRGEIERERLPAD